MQDFLNSIEKIKASYLYLILTVLAVLLTARIQYIQHGWINPDTVLYFESARLIALGQFKEAITVYNWPAYPLCIALTHKLTTLNIHHSAQLLSVIFFAITTASFLKIIELGGGSKKTMITGALILFSSPYIVGDVLEMLMRDQGFWACFLTSLVFFIRFRLNRRYLDAFLWQVFAILATLFRVEAILYLLLLPLVLLLEVNVPLKNRAIVLIKCNCLNILGALIVILALLVNSKLSMQNFGRLQEIFTSNLLQELTYNLATKGQIMSEQVLGKYLQEYAISGLILTFIFAIAVKTILATGAINFALVAYSTKQKKLIKEPTYGVLKATALIALITMSLIITKVFVLSGRYVVALAFILMIGAAFQLGKMLTEFSEGKTKKKKIILALGLIFVFMFGCIIKNVWPKSESYNYMQNSIQWLENYDKKLSEKNVFYNDPRMIYFSNQKFRGKWAENLDQVSIEIANNKINDYDYLMIQYNKKHQDKFISIERKLSSYEEIKQICSQNCTKVVAIFKKIPNE